MLTVPTVLPLSYAVDIFPPPPVSIENELDWMTFQLDWRSFLAYCTFDGG